MDEPRPTSRWRRGRVLLVAAVVVVAVATAAVAALWEVSASPQFCNSCHLMRPYVAAWKASAHGDVKCVQCHYPPGFRDTLWVKFQAMSQVAKWATRTYSSKPFAEVEDASCFRSGCHSRAALEEAGTLRFGRGIAFDHRPHLALTNSGGPLRCTSCHSQIVVERHFEVNTATCFLCHFKGTRTARALTPVAGCTACHEPPKRDIRLGSVTFNHEDVVKRGVGCEKCHLNVVQGQGEAPRERCFSCHNQPEKIARAGDSAFIHAAHVTRHTIGCLRCHGEVRHRLPPPIGAPTAEAGPESEVALGAPPR